METTHSLSRHPSTRQATEEDPNASDVDVTNFGHFASRRASATIGNPSTFSYTRPAKPDDAVGLLPLLLGAIPQAPNNSDTLLFKPFSRKYSPKSSISEHKWELRTKPVVEKVFADMRTCGIKFSSLLTYERTIVDTEIIEKYQQASTDQRIAMQPSYDAIFHNEKIAHTPFLQILQNINEYDKAVSKAYNTHKDAIRANAKTLRVCLKNKFGKNLTAVGVDAGKTLKAELYTKLNSSFIARVDMMKAFNFSAQDIICGIEAWNGVGDIGTAWNDNSAWETQVADQEKLASRIVNACMRLENDYYDQLHTVMSEPGFVETVLKQLVSEKLLSITSKNEVLAPDSKAKWTQFVSSFFKDIIIERLEILQSHLYTFFAATMGTSKEAMDITMKFFSAITHCSFGPAFKRKTVVAVGNNSYTDDSNRLAIAEHHQHYTLLHNWKKDTILSFFEDATHDKTFDVADLQFSNTQLVAEGINGSVWFGTTVLTNFVFPHKYKAFKDWWENNFPNSIEFEKRSTVTESDSRFMHTTTHMGREQLRDLINAMMCKHLNIADTTVPLAHIMATLIAHANGVLDNAFVVAVCAKENNVALNYLRRIYNPLTPPDTTEAKERILSTTNALVNIPGWNTTPTLAGIVASETNANYITLLDKIFKVKKLTKPGFTRPASAGVRRKRNTGGGKSTPRPQSAPAPKGNQKGGDKPKTPRPAGDKPKNNNAQPQKGGAPANKINAQPKKGGRKPRGAKK